MLRAKLWLYRQLKHHTETMVDLDELKEEVTALGEKVKALKDAGEKDAIGPAVEALLAAKQLYADNNNGIGVDGNPYEPPLTKAQKKAKAKAEKAAAGPAKPVRVSLPTY